jgi:hypothetical protein
MQASGVWTQDSGDSSPVFLREDLDSISEPSKTGFVVDTISPLSLSFHQCSVFIRLSVTL